MTHPRLRGKRMWAVVMALVLALSVAACGEKKDDSASESGSSASSGKDCGKVVLNEQAWAGSTANTYIAKAVLEDQLGCSVEVTKIAEIPIFRRVDPVDAGVDRGAHGGDDGIVGLVGTPVGAAGLPRAVADHRQVGAVRSELIRLHGENLPLVRGARCPAQYAR